MQKSSQVWQATPCRDLAKKSFERSCLILPREPREGVHKDLIKISCQEISSRDFVQEVLPRHLLQRSLHRAEAFLECNKNILLRSRIVTLYRSLYTGILHSSFYRELVKEI